MLIYNFFCAYFSSLLKGYLVFKPWCINHSGRIIFYITHSTLYNITYTINHSYIKFNVFPNFNFNSLIRHKFGLCCHYCSSVCALRQLINRPFFFVFVFNVGNYKHIHKLFYKCAFTCPNRSDYTNVNISIRPVSNIFIYIIFVQPPFPLI